METHTESVRHERGRSVDGAQPHLFLVLQADRPLDAPLRVRLGAFRAVEIGRGEGRRAALRGQDLRVDVADRRVSTVHCRLLPLLDGWTVEDAGSKNGTLLNGAPVARAPLADGDVVEAGKTAFIYREAVESGADAVHAAPDGVAGMATLLPDLAAELQKLSTIAASPIPVLIRGESGAGKELAAAAVHALSRRPGMFVPVNCAALPSTLLVSELFGYRKGAFSGAQEDRAGLVRTADSGTLFLDEIGDLSAEGQAALLRVLQEGEVHPLGAGRATKVDVRFVLATHRDLDAMVAAGTFRADLLARIAGFVHEVRPLRERLEDLGLILAAVLRRRGIERATLTAEAVRAMLAHSWPRNVRELDQAVQRGAALAGNEAVDVAQLGLEAARAAEPDDLQERLVLLLRRHQGNVSKVAAELGKGRMQIHRWAKRFGLDLASFRP